MKLDVTRLERELIIDALSTYAKLYLWQANDAEIIGHKSAHRMFKHEHDLARELQKKINRQGK